MYLLAELRVQAECQYGQHLVAPDGKAVTLA